MIVCSFSNLFVATQSCRISSGDSDLVRVRVRQTRQPGSCSGSTAMMFSSMGRLSFYSITDPIFFFLNFFL